LSSYSSSPWRSSPPHRLGPQVVCPPFAIGTTAGTIAAGNDSRITGALQTSSAGPLATQAGANGALAIANALTNTSTTPIPNTPVNSVIRLMYAQQGAETAEQQFGKFFPNSNRNMAGIISGVITEYPSSGAGSAQQSAIYGSSDNFDANNGFAGIFTSICEANSTTCWGINTQITDTGISSDGPTNVRLQNEWDVFVHDPTTTVRGGLQDLYYAPDAVFVGSVTGTTMTVTSVSAPGTTASTGVLAVGQTVVGTGIPNDDLIASLGTGTGNTGTYNLSIAVPVAVASETIKSALPPSSSSNLIGDLCNIFAAESAGHWNICLQSGNGAADYGVWIGDTAVTQVAGLPSQNLQFAYTDTSSTGNRQIGISAQPNTIGAELAIASNYGGKANPRIDNLASYDALNAAGTAPVALLEDDGQDRIHVGLGNIQGFLDSVNGPVLQWIGLANGANTVLIKNAATGSGPTIAAHSYLSGGDANINLGISSLGSGNLLLVSGVNATTATGGFPVIANTTGAPTGSVTVGAVAADTKGQRLCVSVAGGTWRCNPSLVFTSGASVTSAAAAPEQNLVSIKVPANTLGANGAVRVTVLWGYTNDANSKTLIIRHGASSGVAGTLLLNVAETATASAQTMSMVRNANATNSQVVFPANTISYIETSASAVGTGAIDTTADSYINIDCALANSTDEVTVYGYTVEILEGS
jgi:hypothetical protein